MPEHDYHYQRGYYDGLREGYKRALEQLQDLLHQAVNCIPKNYTIVVEGTNKNAKDCLGITTITDAGTTK